jgi:hypothetical protein
LFTFQKEDVSPPPRRSRGQLSKTQLSKLATALPDKNYRQNNSPHFLPEKAEDVENDVFSNVHA